MAHKKLVKEGIESESTALRGRVSELEKELETASQPNALYEGLSERDITVARRFKELAQTNPDDYNRIVEEADPSLTQDGQALREMLETIVDKKIQPLTEKSEYDQAYREADRMFADDKKTLKDAGFDYNDSKNERISKFLRRAVKSGDYATMTEAWESEKSDFIGIVPQRSPEKSQAQKELNGLVETSAGSTHIPEGDRAALASNARAARQSAFQAFSRAAAQDE